MIAGTELNEDGTMGVNDLPQLGPFSYGNHQICSGNQYSEDPVPGQPSPGGIIEDHFTYIDLPPPLVLIIFLVNASLLKVSALVRLWQKLALKKIVIYFTRSFHCKSHILITIYRQLKRLLG